MTISMKKTIAWIKNIHNDDLFVPVLLLIVCIIAFGLFIPQLGYFQDDWGPVYTHYTSGARGLLDIFKHDGRPFASWIYLLGIHLLGNKQLS